MVSDHAAVSAKPGGRLDSRDRARRAGAATPRASRHHRIRPQARFIKSERHREAGCPRMWTWPDVNLEIICRPSWLINDVALASSGEGQENHRILYGVCVATERKAGELGASDKMY